MCVRRVNLDVYPTGPSGGLASRFPVQRGIDSKPNVNGRNYANFAVDVNCNTVSLFIHSPFIIKEDSVTCVK